MMKRENGAVRALLLIVLAATALLVAESPASAAEPEPGCGDGILEDSLGCYTLVDAIAACPADTTLTDGRCRQPVDPQPGPLTCPDGFSLVGSDCIRFVDPTVTRTCTEGTLTGDECIIVGAPPEPGPSTCPVSATVFEDGAECYRLVDRLPQPGTCPPGSVEDGDGRCRVTVADAPGELTCATGFTLVADTCTRSVDPVEVPTCAEGTLDGDRCTIIGPPPTPGPDICPVSGVVFEDGAECYTLVDTTAVDVCSPGTTDDPGGGCRLPVDLVPGLLSCVPPTVLFGDLCRATVPSILACDGGEPIDGGCVVSDGPALPGPPSCPPGALGSPGGCYVLVASVPTQDQTLLCPVGSVGVGGECRRAVDDIRPLICLPGFDLVGVECVGFFDQVPTCPEGILAAGVCEITRPPNVGPPTCPVSGTVFEDGSECYTLVTKITLDVCQAGTTADPGGRCRLPVDRTPGSPMCPTDYRLDGNTCVREAEPVLMPMCSEGTFANGSCVIVGPAPVMGPATCPAGSMGAPGGCYSFVDKVTSPRTCPIGTTADSSGRCRQPVARVPGPLACAAGYTLSGSTCVRSVDPTITQTCSEGTLTEGRCLITTAPVAGPQVCPVPGSTTDCFTASDPALSCPPGSVVTTNPAMCRVNVARPTIVSPIQQLPATGLGATTSVAAIAVMFTAAGLVMLLLARGTINTAHFAPARSRRQAIHITPPVRTRA